MFWIIQGLRTVFVMLRKNAQTIGEVLRDFFENNTELYDRPIYAAGLCARSGVVCLLDLVRITKRVELLPGQTGEKPERLCQGFGDRPDRASLSIAFRSQPYFTVVAANSSLSVMIRSIRISNGSAGISSRNWK